MFVYGKDIPLSEVPIGAPVIVEQSGEQSSDIVPESETNVMFEYGKDIPLDEIL